MSLRLTESQLRKIEELQQLLLTPLRFPTPSAWSETAQQLAGDLFGIERSLLVLPLSGDEVLQHSLNIERDTLHGLDAAIVGTGAGVNQYGDPVLNRAMHRLAGAGVEIWTRQIAERVGRIELAQMPRFYPEVVRPGRLEGMLVMSHSLPEGRAMFSVYSEDSQGPALGDYDVEVFRLLLPAFKAGCRAHAVAAHRRDQLRANLDLLEDGVAVFRGGDERYRNRALQRMVAAEVRPQELLGAMVRCDRRLVDMLATRHASPTDVNEDVSAALTTPTNRYRLAAMLFEGGVDGSPPIVFVVVQPVLPPLPDEAELQKRYGLTARQAEVALLLARGLSNRAVAERLSISPHTARHHAQRVLEKVGTNSRKALALDLLGAGR